MNDDEVLLLSNGEYFFAILATMVIAGILGGYASYFLNESDNKTKRKSIALGIVAAMIVPVFLNTISSNLLIESQKNVDKFFIFSGFCVLASVFSRNFLENIYNKVLQQVGTIGKQVKQIVDTSSEPELPTSDISTDILKTKGITLNEFKLLNALSSGKYTYRSVTGLTKDSELDRDTANSSINTLTARGLVCSRITSKKRINYFLSNEGRVLLGELSMAQDEDV